MKTKLSPVVVVCLALAAGWINVSAADLPQSGTNTISGLVRFTNADADILARLGAPGNEGMTTYVILAGTEPPDSLGANKYFLAADYLSNPYELTVTANNVPLIYDLYADIALDGNTEEYWTALQVAPAVTSNSAPAIVNLDECVALIELRYQLADGTPVAASSGRALVSETATGLWRARYLTQPAGRTNNFLVVPSGVEFELVVEVDTGTDVYLDRITHRETHTMTLACDDKIVLIITIPDAGALGRIIGNVNLVDEIELPSDGYLELLGRPVIKARGPSNNQRYAVLDAETPGGDVSRPFALEGLVPSLPAESWRVQAEMQFGSGYRFEYFTTPALGQGFNPGVEVTAGATADVGDTFVMTPARLVGTITLTGPPEIPGTLSALRGLVRAADYDYDLNGVPDSLGAYGIYGSYAIATGVDELAPGATHSAAGGQATASFAGAFNPATAAFEGDYEAIVGMLNDQPGVWKYDGLNLVFSFPGTNGGPFVDESLYVTEDTPWQGTLAPGEIAHNDVRYGLAEVCLRIRSPASFIYPRVNAYGGLSGIDSFGQLRSYHASLANASSPPYYPSDATNEAIVTMYLPEGTYTLYPAISIIDPAGGQSETQLPGIEVTVSAGERLCVEDCLRLVITPPLCTPNYGFLIEADAFSCDSTLTNLSLTTRPLGDPSVRLGYSDIRILQPVGIPRATLHTAHGLFPEFDGRPREDYRDMVITAVAKDTQGRVATRQIIAHYDLTPPTINCPGDTNVYTEDPSGAVVEFTVTATDDRPEPLLGPTCVPPSGSFFPVGITTVTCKASDLCRNTNTCTFDVIVGPPPVECRLNVALTPGAPPQITLTWDCAGVLQCAPNINGPWTSLVGTTSLYTTPADGPKKFFRLCLSGDCSGDVVSNCNPPGLFAHEPFDYTAGSVLDTLNGGTGFSGPWSATINGPNYVIASGSLTFSPLCASGGRMTSATGHTQMARTLSSSFGADGTTRYFSFLLRPEGELNGGDLGGFHGLQIQGAAAALFVGKPGGAGGGVLAPYVLEEVGGAGQVLSPVTPAIDETVLLVVKAEFAAGNDTFTLYVNPTPGSPEPVTGTVKSDLDLGTSNSLLIYSGGEFSLDELRVGETFESVTPR